MTPTLARIGIAAAVALACAAIFGLMLFLLIRLWPHHDTTPVTVARHDEKAAAVVSQAVGARTEANNRDATLTIDLVKKDIADAFQSLPPAPVLAPDLPRTLPAAPVERVRDRINEGIARANGAAGAPPDPD